MNTELNLTAVDFNPFEGGELEKTTPAIESQQEIWASCIIGGDDANRSYNESVSLFLEGTLNRSAMERALREITNRHEALRASVSADGKNICIYKDTPISIGYEDLVELDLSAQKQYLKDFDYTDAEQSFNLQDGPLFRAIIFKLSDSEHVVRLTAHHIICDGWSFGIILEDLGKLYSAYVQGQSPVLEEAISFSQYATEITAFYRTDMYKDTEQYWINQYKGDIPVLDLPTDFPRPVQKTYKSRRDDFPLDQDLVTAIKKTGAKAGVSLVSTLMVAFELYLNRKTGQQDIVLGLPSAGQSAVGYNALVGHCVNLLPLRSQPKGDLSFVDYLKLRKSQIMDDYEHQQFTFGSLLKKLNIARDSSRVPLVPVVFNIDIGMDANLSFQGLKHQLVSNPRLYENFEIFLNATGTQQSMILEWSYNINLFKPETISHMMDEFVYLLKELINKPDHKIDTLSLSDNQQLSNTNTGYNADVWYSKNETVTRLIGKASEKYPAKTAIYFKDGQLTYKEVDEQSTRMANYLIQQGLKKGEIIAISLDRNPTLIVSLIAVMKAGGVYLPLDPEYPANRIEFMLQDSSAKLLLTDRKRMGLFGTITKELNVQDLWLELASVPNLPLEVPLDGSDLAYVLYTSGSTGKPKGVQIEHKSLTNFLLSMQSKPGIAVEDVLLAVTTISFDIAGLELYLPLISGAQIILADSNTAKDGRLLLELMEKRNVTMMQATPSSWRMLIDAGLSLKHNLKVLCGGEAFPIDLAKSLLESCKEVWNMYGPTETTIWSAVKQITADMNAITIGHPINNTQFYVLDTKLRSVEIGAHGEIFIAGDGLARGYLNRAELTAERFLNNPFSSSPSKMYRTGDVGKFLENGELQCLGRIDQQVKIRGYRIEPGEIEHALVTQNGIKEAVVVAVEDNFADHRLVAYIVPDKNDGLGWKERWEDLYELGVKNEQNLPLEEQNLDIAIISQYNSEADIREHGIEWTNEGLKRLRKLQAKSIMELGTGGGHLLLALAPGIDKYVATDYSNIAINKLKEKLAVHPENWKHVQVYEALADDFTGIEGNSFDLVFLHGVVQYFPSLEYVLKVIEPATKAVRNGGCVYIGDSQTLSAITMHFFYDQLAITNDHISVSEFKTIANYRIQKEEEISIDPDFFYFLPSILPDIKAVDIQIRGGDYANEGTKCHYDVWLYIGENAPKVVEPTISIPWTQDMSLDQLEKQLKNNIDQVIQYTAIPNKRLSKDYALMQFVNASNADTTVKDLKHQMESVKSQGINPTNLWEIGEKLGYNTHVRWSSDGADGNIEVVFIPSSYENTIPAKPATLEIKNKKAYGLESDNTANIITIHEHQLQIWKNVLKDSLPEYMIPGEFIALDKLPTTNNGKIDRNNLPKPDHSNKNSDDNQMVVPVTPTEKLLAKIWSELLGIEQISITSNFFELGGHSLIAVKVMLNIEKEMGKRLPITTLFENSTIEKLAKIIDPNPPTDDNEGGPDTVDPLPQGGSPALIHVPTIDPQKEIWLACELGGENASKAYNLLFSQFFYGDFNAEAMQNALQELINRHESLRATFHKHGDEMHIAEWAVASWHFEDLSSKSEADQKQAIDALSAKNSNTTFNLSEGPLFKAFLIKISEQQHYFTIATHHIVFDGWSYGVAMHELGVLYSAMVKGITPELGDAALFSEYALQKHAYYNTPDYKQIEQYWAEKFQGDLPVLDLSLDFPRPKKRSYESDRITYSIPAELAAGIRKIAISTNSSIAIVLRAALETLLYRLTGQEDVITGIPVAGQLVELKDNLIGHCVNMLPLRSKLDGNADFLSYLNKRKQEILEAYSYQDITFGHLLQILNVTRDQSRPPLISVVMNTALWTDEGSSFYGVKNKLVENKKSFENFELILDVIEYIDGMTIRWDYNKALFEPKTIYAFHQRFSGLLSQVISNPHLLLDEISLIVETGSSAAVAPLSETQAYPALSALIDHAAQNYATSTALLYKNQAISYELLNQRSNQLAHYFINHGIKPGDFTAISLDRTPDMIIVLLGIIKVGSAYLPIDINYPKERISQILLNSDPKLLIIQKNKAENYPEFPGKLFVEDLTEACKTYPITNPNVVIPANNPIYILHTSGSTGKPKGVCMANNALVNLLQWQFRNSTATIGTKTLQFSPLPFDVSFQEIFATLLTGGTLSLISDELRLDPVRLLEHLNTVGINRIFLPFVALQSLTESAETNNTYPNTLKEVMTAGEQLKITPQIIAFFKNIKNAVLFNQYGPTEAHVVTQLTLNGNPEYWPNLPTIGKPIDHTQILILNKQLKEEPAGIVGELCIAGSCLAEGYVNLPELTRDKFVTIERNGSTGLRVYRTGDLARYLADGNIEFLGREDSQVKIRGYRIELAEIETYLNKEPEIKQAVVTVQKDNSGNTRLVAHLTADQLHLLDSELINQWKKNLSNHLPDYMIPFDFVLLKQFPLTATGKIDRKAIPKVNNFSNLQSKNQKPPKTAEEQMLAEIWSAALGVENISIDNDFFEMGGHSLIAVKVMVTIENRTGKRLPLASLFENPTIEKLAELITLQEGEIKWDSLVPIKTSGKKPPLYIVHGWGLNVLGFRNLANVVDQEQPIYGLQAKGMNGSEIIFHTAEETAAHYVKEISLHNSEGPYFLSGYSSGGVIAFEMARQFKKLGKEVAFLAFFDSFVTLNDTNELKKQGKIENYIIYLFNYFKYSFIFFLKNPKSFIINKCNFIAGTIYNIYAKFKPKQEKLTSTPEYAIRQLQEFHDKTLKAYEFKAYDGHAHLFKSNDPETTYFNHFETNGWKPFINKGITRIDLPVGHLLFFEPEYVTILAEKVQVELDKAAQKFGNSN